MAEYHGRRRRAEKMTPFRVVVTVVVVLAVAFGALRFIPGSPLAADSVARWGHTANTRAPGTEAPPASRSGRPSPSPSPSPALPPLDIASANVKVDTSGWWSWAMQDTRTGKISGSANMAETNTTASLIKSWIAADFLRRSAEQGTTPSSTRMEQVRVMIRDSDNDAAQSLWKVVGQSKSIGRLIHICKLTDSSAYKNLWSNTRLSPRDITRLGACIADGRAAGPKWTNHLLKEMRAVRGVGTFGIRKAFPAEEQPSIAIKNGWVDRQATQEYHVSCLAIGDGWTVGVMARYPIRLDYTHGAKICESVGEQLLAAAT
ncbi:serine hydrolase [Plantactinospora sp. GCM10030261]|uniref:serine hydrolase n=1 Tax=Plantactinospora sp. GCM10030261 TaxID=3273420 RepID=UPI003613ACA1